MKLRHLLLASALLPGALALRAADDVPRFSPSHMNREADPRKDFYQFAVGTWAARTEIPSDKSRWGAFDQLGQNNWKRIRTLLEESAAHPGAPGSASQKVGDFFATATDTAAIEAAGLKPLAPDLARVAAIATKEELLAAVAYAHDHVGSPLFGTGVFADLKQSDTNAFYLVQGGLSLPTREYYFDPQFEKFRTGLTEHMAKMFVLAGDAPEAARAQAATVLALETALAEVSQTPTEQRDFAANYHKLTLDEAAAAFAGLPLQGYLAALDFPATEKTVVVLQPKFFEGLGKLLASHPLTEWKTYLRWHTLNDHAGYLSAAFDQESFRFFGTVLNGTPAQEPRCQRAARVCDGQVGFLVGQVYCEKYFPAEMKARVSTMADGLIAVFRDRVKGLDWMSDATKAKALEKLATFKVIVGYPEVWRDYSKLTVTRGSYLDNVRAGAHCENRRQLAKVGQPVDKREFGYTPQTVNAYFDPTTNQLTFLAGILQPPFFDAGLDDAVNYGAIGAVIGHEMTHGFDDNGCKFDKDGNLANWWTPDDNAGFRGRALKLVQQFNGYFALPQLAVNGQLTLGENIADLGGVSMALEAYHRTLVGKPMPEKIDGLTGDQRFFLAWAQNWRTKTRDDRLRALVMSDVHAPGQFRAYGPLVNLPEFYAAFDVKEGDPMWRKPEDRAKIW